MKNKFVFVIVCFLVLFFFYNAQKVGAMEVCVLHKPVASDIYYGQPLFESSLVGGEANVEGEFTWKEPQKALEAGTHSVEVVFNPSEESYDQIILNVNIVVNKRRVYLKFESRLYKQYDESRDLHLPSYVVVGIKQNDNVYVSGTLNATLESGIVTDNTKVMLSGLELIGEKKDNYYLDLEGFTASVYPHVVEKLVGDKNRVELGKGIYVPVASDIYLNKKEKIELEKMNFVIRDVYDVYLESNGSRLDVVGLVKVKVKIKNNLNHRRMHVFNYYNGEYEEIIDYKYVDGYFIYSASSLGELVFAQRKLNYQWLYYVTFIVFLSIGGWIGVKSVKGKKRINRYRSLRRKDDGDY